MVFRSSSQALVSRIDRNGGVFQLHPPFYSFLCSIATVLFHRLKEHKNIPTLLLSLYSSASLFQLLQLELIVPFSMVDTSVVTNIFSFS